MSLIAKKHKKEALAAGLRIVGDGETNGYKIYQWIDCGHLAERHTSAVRKKSIVCKQCVDGIHAMQALTIGLRLMGKGSMQGHKKYRWISCRHICEYRPTAVRTGRVTCQKCAAQWSQPWQSTTQTN